MSQGSPVALGTTTIDELSVLRRREVVLSNEDRLTHTYVCGATRQGKSKLLESMIRQDVISNRVNGSGMLVLDPHAALVPEVVRWMARYDLNRPVVYIDLTSDDWIIGLHLLRQLPGEKISDTAERFVESVAHVWGASDTTATPLFAQWAFNIAYALAHKERTIADAEAFFEPGPTTLKRWLTSNLPDRTVGSDWKRALAMKPDDYAKEVGSTCRRLGPLIKSEKLRRMIGQPHAIDWRRAMDEGWIVFVSFRGGGSAMTALATLILSAVWQAASQREKAKRPRRFHVYLDEFQLFVTPTMAKSLAQAAGFGLSLTMAHQFPHQLKHAGANGAHLLDEVLNNAKTKICFSVGHESATIMSREMSAEAGMIRTLPKRSCVVSAATSPAPIVVLTDDVAPSIPSDAALQKWTEKQMATWRGMFVFSAAEADTNLASAAAQADSTARGVEEGDEPKSAKRIIKVRR